MDGNSLLSSVEEEFEQQLFSLLVRNYKTNNSNNEENSKNKESNGGNKNKDSSNDNDY